jgi:predicted lipase
VLPSADSSSASDTHILCGVSPSPVDCDERAINDWTCGPCKTLGKARSSKYHSNSSADGFVPVYGYTAQLADGSIVIAFRGTEGLEEWLLDFDFFPVPFADCKGCEVHQGFYAGWQALKPSMLASLAEYNAASAPAIYVTGHSLGAAMANVAAYDLLHSFPNYQWSDFYNFGQPRIGNDAYSASYTALVTNRSATNAGQSAYRVVHHQDPVPQLPPQEFGFRHSTVEVWYNEPSTDYMVCSVSDGEDPKCSDSNIDLDFGDHTVYLGIHISGLC